MSNYKWGKPTGYYGDPTPILIANVAEGVTAELYVDYQDELCVSIDVRGNDVVGWHASTNRSQDWPEVERFIPREEWPEEIYAGVREPDVRMPDEAVLNAVAEARADWEEAFREAEEMEAELSGD